MLLPVSVSKLYYKPVAKFSEPLRKQLDVKVHVITFLIKLN